MHATTHIRTMSHRGFAAQGLRSPCASLPGFVLMASAQAGDVTPQ